MFTVFIRSPANDLDRINHITKHIVLVLELKTNYCFMSKSILDFFVKYQVSKYKVNNKMLSTFQFYITTFERR